MFAIAIGVLGAAIGVLLAVLAEVVPDSSGGGRPLDRCGACEASRSFVSQMLPGACPECGHSTVRGRLATIVTTAAVFALSAAVVGSRWQLVPILVMASSLIALSVVDIVRYRLPDRIIFPTLAISIPMLAVLSIANGHGDHVLRAIVTALAYSAILLVFNIISPAGLAFGDVKLALVLGLFLGWVADGGIDAARMVVWALLLGMILGVLSGLGVGVGRRVIGPDFLPDPDFPPNPDGSLDPLLKTAFPFGPALAVAAFSLVLFSESVLSASGILA